MLHSKKARILSGIRLFLLMALSLHVYEAKGRVDSLHHAREHAADIYDRMHASVLLAGELMPEQLDSALFLLEEASSLVNDVDDIRKADYFNTLADYYWYANELDQAIHTFRKVLVLPVSDALLFEMARAANSAGVLYGMTGQVDSARHYLEMALRIDKERENRHGVTKTMYDLGMLHYRQDQYELAMRYLLEVADFQTIEKDTFRLMHTMTLLGNVYYRLDSADKAVDHYRQAAAFAAAIGNERAEAYAWNNLAAYYCTQHGGLEKTLYYAGKGLELAERITDYSALMNLNLNIAEAYLKAGRKQEALSYYLKAYAYYDQQRQPGLQADILIRMGRMYQELERYNEARQYLERGLTIAENINSLFNQSKAHFQLASIDSVQGNFRNALYHYQKGKALADSILNKETKSRIAELQIIYETEKNRLAIFELQQKERINRIWLQSTIAFILLGGMVVFFLIKYLRKRRKVAEQQLTIRQGELENLEVKLNANKQELTGKALSLMKSDDLINILKENIKKIIPKANQDTSQELRSMLKQLRKTDKTQELWKDFETRFNELNDGFISKLVSRYPNLTPVEIRMCAMLRLQLSSKDIADLTNRSYRTIEYTRTNIRQKVGLKPGQNLTSHILNI